jgi:hypothetical protein
VTAAYLGLVAVSSDRLRKFAALAMQDSAVRAAHWRGSTQAFPGLPALDVLLGFRGVPEYGRVTGDGDQGADGGGDSQ